MSPGGMIKTDLPSQFALMHTAKWWSSISAQSCRLATSDAAVRRSAKLPLGWRQVIHSTANTDEAVQDSHPDLKLGNLTVEVPGGDTSGFRPRLSVKAAFQIIAGSNRILIDPLRASFLAGPFLVL